MEDNVQILVAFIGILTFVYLIKQLKKVNHISCNAPGPKGLPFLGNAHQIDSAKLHQDLTALSFKYGDVYQFSMMGQTFLVLNSPKAYLEAMVKRGTDFAGRQFSYRIVLCGASKDIIFRSYSNTLKLLRKVVHHSIRAFSSGMTRIEEITSGAAGDLVQEFGELKGQSVDPKVYFYRATCRTLVMLMFGNNVSIDDPIVDFAIEADTTFFSAMDTSVTGLLLDSMPWLRYLRIHPYADCVKMEQLFHKFFNEWILPFKKSYNAAHERGVADALLKEIYEQEKNGGYLITDEDLAGTLIDLLTAGVSTTTLTMYGFLPFLLHHPEIQETLQQEIDTVVGPDAKPSFLHKEKMPYTQATLYELLRITNGPLAVPHEAMCDTEVQGYTVPKGMKVIINSYAIQHHPNFWEDPFVFNPQRFLDEDGKFVAADHPNRKNWLPFGSGPRVCVGENFAINRLFMFISSLLQKFTVLPDDPNNLPSCDPRNYGSDLVFRIPSYKIRFVERAN